MKYPIALSIAGSDSGGGAGIEADIKTMSAIGVFATTVITAVTAQNTLGVYGIHAVPVNMIESQIDAVFEDFHPDTVKIGMLFSKDIIETVAQKLRQFKPKNIVLDPVMCSSSGSRLISEDAIYCLKTELMPLATIITPNKMEAEHLSGIRITDTSNLRQVASEILKYGCKYVLIKGGHFDTADCADYLFDGKVNGTAVPGRFIHTDNTHGTGCTLSSAIAAFLSIGQTLPESVTSAKSYLQAALEAGANVETGLGHGPLNHFFNPQKLIIK